MAPVHSTPERLGPSTEGRVGAADEAAVASARALERASGTLTTAAIARMDARLPWYRAMRAEDRSWVGLVLNAGVRQFTRWLADPAGRPTITADVFGAAPRELTRAITLHQTVQISRVIIEVVEESLPALLPPDSVDAAHRSLLVYSREVAFAAADVYARAAEARGSWDARLEALVVDALMRGEIGEEIRSRAAALGWTASSGVTVLVGRTPASQPEVVADGIRQAARSAGLDVLTGVQGDRLVVVLGGATNAEHAATIVAAEFAPGPIIVGPLVSDLMVAASSARAAVAGLRAVAGWPAAPRPVLAEDLLPERALNGDGHARRRLVDDVYAPLAEAGAGPLETLATFLETGRSVEGTARSLYVHPNTVRYRLKRVIELTGLSPTDPRDAYTLHIAISLGRLLPNAGA